MKAAGGRAIMRERVRGDGREEGKKRRLNDGVSSFGGLFLLSSTSVGCACAVFGAESDRLSQNLLIFLCGPLTWRVLAILRPSGMKTSADRRHTHSLLTGRPVSRGRVSEDRFPL